MSYRRFRRALLLWASVAVGATAAEIAAPLASLHAQPAPSAPAATRVSVLYTGKSLGALGVRRAQDEHDLLTEQAVREGLPFKLVSHAAWRAPGIVVFLPGTEPDGDELAEILARRQEAERLTAVPALMSSTVLMVSDPWRPERDLLAMLGRNPRRTSTFADLVPTQVTVSRLRTSRDDRAILIEQPGAVWPTEAAAFTLGEMNRIDVGDSRLFELPFNLGELGPRAALVAAMRRDSLPRPTATFTADLGTREALLGVQRSVRGRTDFAALAAMGYGAVVPYEFELGLGPAMLDSLRQEFPGQVLLAANVRAASDSTLLKPWHVDTLGGARIGFIGLVSPAVRLHLGKRALSAFVFDDLVTSARRAVAAVRAVGVDAVVALSNLEASDNALVAQEVTGLDAIIADLSDEAGAEAMRVRVELPARPFVRPGPPALVARGSGNGMRVGRLDLEFAPAFNASTNATSNARRLAALEHRTASVTDAVMPDSALVRRVTSAASRVRQPRGDLLFPAFGDIVERYPTLAEVDATTRSGRMSKDLWEQFLARLARDRGRAEVAVLPRLEFFPPLIGKLHESEVREWLWTEDEIVLVDLPGSDLSRLLRGDARNELATSGVDRAASTVMGRPIDDATFYRVATTDLLFEGARARFFSRARRVRRAFRLTADGMLLPSPAGAPVALRDFTLEVLRQVRREAKGDAQIDRIAAMVAPDTRFVNLLSFAFERPTLWASANQTVGNAGYEKVPESRVVAPNAWVAGLGGRFVASHDRPKSATDVGLLVAFAEQHMSGDRGRQITETADDIKLDVTLRPSSRTQDTRWHPFVRGLFDSEFTPTRNALTGASNARQLAVRGVAGWLRMPSPTVRRAELGLAVENDFARPNVQVGVQGRAEIVRAIAGTGAGAATYRWINDLTYLFPSRLDNEQNLALRYGMIHEIIVPLVDELSFSVSADVLFFQGKVAATRRPGASAQLRVGLTYDRLWKPRYQPFL
jgi:hypothetical protein